MASFQTLPNGFKIPSIGYGTTSAQENALDHALEIGFRHLDTAYVYQSEALIGKVLKKWIPNKIKREDIFITSKFPPRDGFDPEETIKKTLEDLQLDYVDLYLIHWPSDDNESNLRIWRKLEEQVDAGRAKYIGLSNFTVEQIEYIVQNARIKPVNLQVQLHFYGQRKELVEYCKKNNITVVAWSPLGSPGNKHGGGLDIMENDTVKQIAKKYNKLPAQIALRFLIQKNIIPIPKSVTPERIGQNFNVFDFVISEEDVKILEALDKNVFKSGPPRPPKKD
ncbi:unnamed protein product [Diabrotica balteata]|uniref:NADP-dependent oxidoreductase domain-containing protein n=1 Tax=Diabrotica balteata TaxID=107213 RepID=A0A9N9XDD4_DIABA|nr:unnamed protein product [Diabrotica balteata]